MFCVECGKIDDIFKEGVCFDCYIKSNYLTKGVDTVGMIACPHCNSIKYKNNWTNDSFENILKREIKNNFYISRELKKVEIKAICNKKNDFSTFKIIISGFIKNRKITEEHNLDIRLKKIPCDVCSRKFGGYHEAVIQIRAKDRDLSQKELINLNRNVNSLVKIFQDKGNRSLFITDIEEEHGGLDIYLSDKGTALAITKKIFENFGGVIKKSSKNVGMKDGRQIYKMTYLIRLPHYRKKDIIYFNKHHYIITSINSDKIHVMELSSWNKQVFTAKDFQEVKIIGGEELIRDMLFISQSENEVQLMDAKNFKIYTVNKIKKEKVETQVIKTIKVDDNVYFIPKITNDI